ncbi:hypothetical protein [Parasphingorhabdus halotolerans]|nr:hypothetical protein [Parasphingorhabdus halotolerans]
MLNLNIKSQITAALAAVISAVIFVSVSVGPATTQIGSLIA